VLAGAGLALRAALVEARRRAAAGAPRSRRRLAAALILTLLLGGAFLVLQAAVWVKLGGRGFGPGAGAYASVFYALSGFHALHVLGGMVALSIAGGRALRARFAQRVLPLQLVAAYWDFMLAVWAVLYLVVCVL